MRLLSLFAGASLLGAPGALAAPSGFLLGHGLRFPLVQAEPVTPRLREQAPHDVIKTKDGGVHTGRILRETERGYLFKPTDGNARVIPFADIVDVQSSDPNRMPIRAPEILSGDQPDDRRLKLANELRALKQSNLSFTGATFSFAIGGVLTAGALLLFVGAASTDLMTALALIYLGVYSLLFGIPFIVAGFILNSQTQTAMANRDRRIEELESELRGSGGPAPPGPVPPPPPPPPTGGLRWPATVLTVARF